MHSISQQSTTSVTCWQDIWFPHGIIATADEKLNLLVQKVGLIPSGSSTEKTIVYDANHKEGIYLSYNDVVYGLSDFVTEHSAFCSEKTTTH